jgi:magnesium chelatase subunit D
VPPPFSFSAIVGQDTLKRALLLSVIQPSLGGVLVRGTKGVAKSTAVRALAGLLPQIATIAGCPFQRQPGEAIPDWPLSETAPVISRPVPLVELPLGATEDRVLGSLHLERALRGERSFEPGLLAAANRGILYIDEVNLLPDHLVDVLLDAAASGVHRVEREGLSLTHPARFVLVGTMNPEEGELRPQLLDRFGLVADVTDLADVQERAEAVRRRLAYDADPDGFTAAWATADAGEATRLVEARRLLPSVSINDDLLRAMSERCLAAGVEGLRADLTLCKAACAWAAYQGRTGVELDDVEVVAELALAHRRTRPPSPPPPGRGREPKNNTIPSPKRQQGERATGSPREPSSIASSPSEQFASAGLFVARVHPDPAALLHGTMSGGWRVGRTAHRNLACGEPRTLDSTGSRIAWATTLRAAAPYQRERQGEDSIHRLVLCAEDLRIWPHRGPVGCLLLFVLDTSGSMAAWQRIRQTKSAVLALLLQAYQRRDRIALLAFRGDEAELVLPPSRGLQPARHALEALPVGGTTPLARGLAAACRLVRQQQRRHRQQPIWTVVLTDGRANVAGGMGDPWIDAQTQARSLASCSDDCLVVDTETGWPRFGRARELARTMGARSVGLEEVLGAPLRDSWRAAM